MMKIYLPSELGYEKVAIGAVAVIAKKIGFRAERIDDLKTATAEAVTNAIEHGNQLDSAHKVLVALTLEDTALVLRVVDRGCRPIPPIPQEHQQRANHRGWGLFLMKNLMDEVEVVAAPGWNEVRLVAYLGEGDANFSVRLADKH